MSSPASLRDLYAPPANIWSFQATPANASDANATPPPASGSYQWSTRPAPNSLLGLPGSIEDDEGVDAKALVMGLVTSGLVQYATTAIAVPWEVGKTLLQVQWIPRDVEELPARDLHVTLKDQDEDGEVC
jgi:mitochondrial fusion and transport protein UGO1